MVVVYGYVRPAPELADARSTPPMASRGWGTFMRTEYWGLLPPLQRPASLATFLTGIDNHAPGAKMP